MDRLHSRSYKPAECAAGMAADFMIIFADIMITCSSPHNSPTQNFVWIFTIPHYCYLPHKYLYIVSCGCRSETQLCRFHKRARVWRCPRSLHLVPTVPRRTCSVVLVPSPDARQTTWGGWSPDDEATFPTNGASYIYTPTLSI